MNEEIAWRDDRLPVGVRVGRGPDGLRIVEDKGVRWVRPSWDGRFVCMDMLPLGIAAGW